MTAPVLPEGPTGPRRVPRGRAAGTDADPRPRPARPDPGSRVLMKGNVAIAEAAIAAGCDAYFGYPITPQAEILERMAARMPEEGRVFVQAESEIAAISMALGAAATGARVLVSSSSPGISLMAEAMSYLAGDELPLVLVNVMRGGPGLGSIGPSQADYFQATKGHGHGDYRVPVLAPGSIREATELVPLAFTIAERYRTPVMLLLDGLMGQAMEPVDPVFRALPPSAPDWALTGARDRAPRVIHSLHLQPEDQEAHAIHLAAKAAEIARRETRWATEQTDDAEILVVAYGTSARVARSAIAAVRATGLRAGLFRPVSLWPFPSDALRRHAERVRAVLVVEMSLGQMVEDVRLAVEGRVPVAFHGRTGGVVPTPGEVAEMLHSLDRGTRPADPWRIARPHPDAARDDAPDPEPDPVALLATADPEGAPA